jgi:hypothetical protein
MGRPGGARQTAWVRCSVRRLALPAIAALVIAALTACQGGGLTQTPMPMTAPQTAPQTGNDATAPSPMSDADKADTSDTSASDGAPITNAPETARSPVARSVSKQSLPQTTHRSSPSPLPSAARVHASPRNHARTSCPRGQSKVASSHCQTQTPAHKSAAARKKHPASTCRHGATTTTGKSNLCK